MLCTVAAVVAFLGYMPPRGTVITVPRSRLVELSPSQRAKAERCAEKYQIEWKIDENR
jgi:hypothetical protein